MVLLEGKEVEGKIGEDGSYSVDVNEKGVVLATVSFAVDKEITEGLKVKANVSGEIEMRAATLVAAQAAKSDNKILKYIAKLLKAVDDGEEAHPEVLASMETHYGEEEKA